MTEMLVETKGLKKYFKTASGMLHAVDGVDLFIRKGQTLGVVGESGCGKSTLGRIIIKLIEPTEGKVFIDGQDISTMKGRKLRQFRKNMQIIFQDPYASLHPRLSVAEIIAEPMIVNRTCASRAEVDREVRRLMDTVGLASRFINSYPHELDGGRRQRIGIARALALKPRFIVCDEPVSALDVSIQAQILNLLMDLQRDMGLTYLFITHDLSVVKHISDHIAVMYLGQCVEYAPSKELFANPLHPYTKALLSAIPSTDLSSRGRRRELLQGEVSSPIDPPPGCRFAARCPHACASCTGTDMALKQVAADHMTACPRCIIS